MEYENEVSKYAFERIEKTILRIVDANKQRIRTPLSFEEIEKDRSAQT